jgi:antitoxin VapB
MIKTTVFQSNRTQAVRLPKAVALPDNVKEVEITVVGASRVLTPAGRAWDAFFDGPTVSDDFMTSREQPAPQARVEF